MLYLAAKASDLWPEDVSRDDYGITLRSSVVKYPIYVMTERQKECKSYHVI